MSYVHVCTYACMHDAYAYAYMYVYMCMCIHAKIHTCISMASQTRMSIDVDRMVLGILDKDRPGRHPSVSEGSPDHVKAGSKV